MANDNFPKSEIRYLKNKKINTTKKYIKYLNEKYENDLNRVMDYEWDYYHHLNRKSRSERIKMGNPTIKDMRALSRLEQEETSKIKQHLKAKGIKFDAVPVLSNSNPVTDEYARKNYPDVIANMSNYAYKTLLKKLKNKKVSSGPTIKQLSSKDYLDYLRKKHKFLFTDIKK